MDDVLNVSGHRLGTAEIEDAMVGCCNDIVLVFSFKPHLLLSYSCYRLSPHVWKTWNNQITFKTIPLEQTQTRNGTHHVSCWRFLLISAELLRLSTGCFSSLVFVWLLFSLVSRRLHDSCGEMIAARISWLVRWLLARSGFPILPCIASAENYLLLIQLIFLFATTPGTYKSRGFVNANVTVSQRKARYLGLAEDFLYKSAFLEQHAVHV